MTAPSTLLASMISRRCCAVHLTKLVIEQQAALDAAEATLLSSQLEVEKLKIELLRLKRMQFGRSSEQLELQIVQLELTLEDLEASSSQIPLPMLLAEQSSPAKPVQRALPPGLSREVITHPSPCACPQCGGVLRSLGEDVAEILEYVPSRFKVIQHPHVRRKFHDIHQATESPVAAEALARIGALYGI